jgi:hypothetical protein
MNPQGRNPKRGTALGYKPGARTIITSLTVWAARPRDAKPPGNVRTGVVTITTLSSTYNTNYIRKETNTHAQLTYESQLSYL